MKSLKSIIVGIKAVAEREVNRITSKSLYILVMLVFPLLSILFFGTLFKDGIPTKMPIAIVDLDQSVTSRKMARSIDATPMAKVTMYLQSEIEAMSELRKGNIYGFVILPKNLQADIMALRQPVISYYFHNSFLTAGGLVQSNLATVLRSLSAGVSISKREAMGQSKEYILSQVQPIQRSTHMLFNPTITYSVYLSTIVMPIMLQIFILLMTVYCIGIEIKERTSREWLRLSNKSIFVAITGKLLPYTVVFYIVMMFQNFLLYKVMQVPMNTSLGWLMFGSLMFVLAYQALGVLFIGVLPLMRYALNIAAFFGILALSLCGFSFPTTSMPPIVQYWSNLLPARHYMHIFQSQILTGFELRYSLPSYLYLLIFMLLPLLVLNRLKSALIYQTFIENIGTAEERSNLQ